MLSDNLPIESDRCCRMNNPMIIKRHPLILALLLGACSAAPTSQPAPQPVHTATMVSCPPAKEDSKLGEIIRYYSHISALASPDIVNEYNAVSVNYAKHPNNAERIKLAMLLSLPNTAFHNTAAARDLLATWPDQDAASDLHDLARFFGALLAQQQQADETANDLGKALASEKMHSKSLQGKIDAIKAFEINQPHRDQP